jgi:hypothetical protein
MTHTSKCPINNKISFRITSRLSNYDRNFQEFWDIFWALLLISFSMMASYLHWRIKFKQNLPRSNRILTYKNDKFSDMRCARMYNIKSSFRDWRPFLGQYCRLAGPAGRTKVVPTAQKPWVYWSNSSHMACRNLTDRKLQPIPLHRNPQFGKQYFDVHDSEVTWAGITCDGIFRDDMKWSFAQSNVLGFVYAYTFCL